MPFVKDTSYRDLPFSPETPGDGNPSFLTVRDLIEKMSCVGSGQIFRCRTVGIVTCNFGQHMLHDIDDDGAHIRISLEYYARPLPYGAQPYPAQLFGYVQRKLHSTPVIFPHIFQCIPVFVAVRIRETMKWVTETHRALYGKPED